MNVTVKLQFPIGLADGRKLEEINLRRAKVRDMKTAQRATKDQIEQEILLLATLSEERLTPEDIEELDAADYAKIQDAFQRMVGAAGIPAAG